GLNRRHEVPRPIGPPSPGTRHDVMRAWKVHPEPMREAASTRGDGSEGRLSGFWVSEASGLRGRGGYSLRVAIDGEGGCLMTSRAPLSRGCMDFPGSVHSRMIVV